jgi:heme/copper-type cytochrome/quinol oxidase subunit 3
MVAVAVPGDTGVSAVLSVPVRDLPWEVKRGTGGMYWFIVTETMLFVALFFTYFYLGRAAPRWPLDEPPKLMLASLMLVVLLSSSGVLLWAERLAKQGRERAARGATLITIALGIGFIALQVFEYRDHLRKLLPTADSYGSIFYTITTIHGAHVTLGLLMLGYAVALPKLEPAARPPHRPLHNAALYWHFVDIVWIFIVAVLYYLPHLQ